MRQHDLAFANFILRFGTREVLLDYAKEIVLPAFTRDTYVRTFGETSYYFHDVKLRTIDRTELGPVVTLSGHFVKDTVLRRQQVFRAAKGLVEDEDQLESAPSSYFILILNNHRLLYFAETAFAPPLSSFRSTVEIFLRRQWRTYLQARHASDNRRGRVTMKQLRAEVPTPVLSVVPIAGEDRITESIKRFRVIKQIRLKLIKPNDEIDASAAVAAVEETFRPLGAKRLEILASDAQGLDKQEAAKAVASAAKGQNTEIIVSGEDEDRNKLRVDNDELALSVPVDAPPEEDDRLRRRLLRIYNGLRDAGKVRAIPMPDESYEKVAQLVPRR